MRPYGEVDMLRDRFMRPYCFVREVLAATKDMVDVVEGDTWIANLLRLHQVNERLIRLPHSYIVT